MASTLASKKTYSLAVIVPEPLSEEAYWNKPLIGVRKAFNEIQQYGVEITVFVFKQTDASFFKTKAKELLQNRYDGVVLAPFFSRESKDFARKLEALEIPFVFIDSNLKGTSKISYIGQNSFQSGTLAAKLLDFSVPGEATIMIIHFAKEMDNQNHLVQREMGFYNYFEKMKKPSNKKIITVEINDPSNEAYFAQIDEALQKAGNVKGIFVTNSMVYKVAEYLKAKKLHAIRLIGHDLIPNNVAFMEKDVVDFLICQRPEEQGYQSVMTLFQHIILKKEVSSENYTSIDIITKENLDFYQEFNSNNYGTN
ncbi:MAG TPA: substrate-binding domain-containing protein [Sunxiuqinia sp.]|nr:substrate-binding domain-containing protein [Sunxiuqinia sp.]